ncbi:MAG: ABC transporter ATP-binding protein [Pelagibacteraceae bacterium]|jgi:branched-chain amino acid transport system ATP-binding protein|nr:ABC transporter ATP-binding protein [Pelagibacteraceae bacterium]MCI5079707.1 ABC transporter ATP-binding protein [Pelagibacteraceae bacterium]
MLLEIKNIDVLYDDFQVIWDVSLNVKEGEMVALLGPNGSGKSTILNTTSNLITPKKGSIQFQGNEISTLPTFKRTEIGISHVLERRRVFPHLTVLQNLNLGAFHPKAKEQRSQSLEKIYKIFPKLGQREDQLASTMSGGEQQMLAIARGLMGLPKLLMVDEPFLGLSPMVTQDLIKIFKNIVDSGISILFVEQNVRLALSMATRGFILESGRLVISGESKDLVDSPEVRRVFLGS